MKVKVCGITSYDDAAMALDAGADALGFNFFPRSPRFTDAETARAIITRLPPFVAAVGVFVNSGQSEIVKIAQHAGVRILQLHGDEDPGYCRGLLQWTLIKALRISEKPIEGSLSDYPVQAFLLDTRDDGAFGGTGRSFDWDLARQMDRDRPIILAGGLRPENVRVAIQEVRPYAVDVCSGVESSPGKKDRAKLVAFMDEVRNA